MSPNGEGGFLIFVLPRRNPNILRADSWDGGRESPAEVFSWGSDRPVVCHACELESCP